MTTTPAQIILQQLGARMLCDLGDCLAFNNDSRKY